MAFLCIFLTFQSFLITLVKFNNFVIFKAPLHLLPFMCRKKGLCISCLEYIQSKRELFPVFLCMPSCSFHAMNVSVLKSLKTQKLPFPFSCKNLGHKLGQPIQRLRLTQGNFVYRGDVWEFRKEKGWRLLRRG